MKMVALHKPAIPSARCQFADWGSHLPTLVRLLYTFQPKRILELGCGDWSTPILHDYVTGLNDRILVSAENNPEWLANMSWMRNAQHDMRLVSNWTAGVLGSEWDLVLVDQAPESDRVASLSYFSGAGTAKITVLHDAQYPDRYGHLYPFFKYILHDKRYTMQTSVFSNVVDVTALYPNAVEETPCQSLLSL